MKKFIYIALAALILLTASSCKERSVRNRSVIAYVARLLADTTDYDYGILSAFDPKSKSGTIAVLGEPEEALLLTEALMTSDRYDNIHGNLRSDGLPDFAGEVFAPVLDVANAPYHGYVAYTNEDFLSEVTVRNFLAALDTACYLNSYDKDRLVPKSPAKMVVLASSYAAAYGYFEIDTLCRRAGKPVPVFSAPHSMLDYVWNRHGKGFTLGVWTTSDVLGAGVWSTVFPRSARRHGDAVATYEAFCPESSSTVVDRFMEFMSMYASVGNPGKLSAIVLDDPSVSVDELRSVVESVLKVDEDSYITWRNYLADDFEIIDPATAVAASCYTYLREYNLFTHKIAYPEVKVYTTAPVNGLPEEAYAPDGWLNEEFRYSRGSNVEEASWSMVELKDKYLTTEMRDLMIVKTPKIFSLYVR